MPTYQYACTACGHQLEAVQSFSDAPLTACPECDGHLRKVFSSVGIVFKGSGFYRTDSRSGSPSDGNGSGDGKGSTDGAGASKPASSGSDSGSTSAGSSGSGSSGSGSSGSGSASSGSSGSSTSSAKPAATVST